LLANVTRLVEGRNALAISIVVMGQSLAGIFAPPILRFAMDEVGWRTTYLWQGVFCAAIIVPLSLLLWRQRRADAGAAEAAEAARVLRAPKIDLNVALVLLFAAIIFCCVPMAVPMVHLIALVTDLGHPAPRAAEMLSGMMLVAVLARLLAGWLADRIGGLQTLFLMSAWQALILVVFMQVESLTALYVTSIVFGIGFGGIIPCYAIVIGNVFPLSGQGWRIATIFFGGTIGMAAGGWLGGLIYDATGSYFYAFVMGIGCNVVNLAIVGAMIFTTRAPRPEVAAA
jgi:predicted MFS family arabinose efflux permease